MKARKATITLAWELLARACARHGDIHRPLLPRWVDADDYPDGVGFALPVADRAASRARGFDRWLLYEGTWR
jgi:hypothetical protein